jgi:riboflavin biosynthesis pyrimidine reductase
MSCKNELPNIRIKQQSSLKEKIPTIPITKVHLIRTRANRIITMATTIMQEHPTTTMKVAMLAPVSTTITSRIRLSPNTKAIHSETLLLRTVQTTIMRIKKTMASVHHMGSSNSFSSSFISRKCSLQWPKQVKALGCGSISITLIQSCSLIVLDSIWEAAQILA